VGEKDIYETYKETIAKISEGWLVGTQMSDIPKPFIEKVISSCLGCHLEQPVHKRTVRSFRRYTTRYIMPLAKEEGFLNNLKAQHSVRLMSIHQYRVVRPYPSTMRIYVCH